MNLNAKQIIAIMVAVLSVLSGSTAQLTDLLGPTSAKVVISIASLTMTILSSIMAVLTSQNQTVKEVAAMPGVAKVTVNADANQVLAAAAIDPGQPKIGATSPDVRDVLIDKAKGG